VFAPLVAGAAGTCCGGDCNSDGLVRIDEVIRMIDVALGNAPVSAACQNAACPCPGPDPGEICEATQPIRAVRNALEGCPR
jgi:hypothetical protein